MLHRLFPLAVCGLALVSGAHAQTDPPLSAELHVGTADGEPRLIWIPTRWTPAVAGVHLKRRAVGTTEWQKLDRVKFLSERDKIMLTHATPADYERLHQELLSDFDNAWDRGFAYDDELLSLPKSDYEYGVFVRVGEGDFLEDPVATAVWKEPPPRNYDAGLKPLGVFRDANGVQVQLAVDARRMLSWAMGVRVIESGGHSNSSVSPLLIPATREGWTAFCYRLKEPLPSSLIFSLEDQFGDSVWETIWIKPGVALGKPAVGQQVCMPVRPSLKPVYKLPPPKLSKDIELAVGAKDYRTRILWIPKSWPAGMEGVQIMRRRAGEPWTAVEEVRPSQEFKYKLEQATTPEHFANIRQELRSSSLTSAMANFRLYDRDSHELLDGVVEYGAFPVIAGKRSAEPAATVPWLVGSESDANFGLVGAHMVRGTTGLVAMFAFDAARFKEMGGKFRLFRMTSDEDGTQYAEVSASASAQAWKHLCVPIEPGKTKAVKVIAENIFGITSTIMNWIDVTPVTTDLAATAQCFVPPPVISQVATPRPAPL